jgi:hypothetical protein
MVYRALTKSDVLNVWVGFDSREPEAYDVARASILKHATMAVNIQKLDERALRHAGLYSRKWHAEGHQKIDDIDGKPFSTEFSFSRFLVPSLMQWEGWGLFIDSDQLFVADIAEMLHDMDPAKAVMVCKQNYEPHDGIKMDGMRQEKYFRKNWSSVMLFNCSHGANKLLSPSVVNGEPGSWLHGFGWLRDDEIGDMNHGWNWIDGTTTVEPKNVHFTLGGPWFPHMRNLDEPYFEEWRQAAKEIGVWRSMCAKQDKTAA